MRHRCVRRCCLTCTSCTACATLTAFLIVCTHILRAVRARYRALELRTNKAMLERERLRALILDEQPQKRQRVEHPKGEYWHEWELQVWRSLEAQAYVRRLRVLSAEAPARASNELPRGERAGFLHHPRRGLIGALRDWAEGSKADAAKMVFALIKELELEVPMCNPISILIPIPILIPTHTHTHTHTLSYGWIR